MYNQGLIKYNYEQYYHFISIGPQGPGSSVIFEFEVYYYEPNLAKRNVNYPTDQLETISNKFLIMQLDNIISRRKRNENDLADQLETLVSLIYLKYLKFMNFNNIISC